MSPTPSASLSLLPRARILQQVFGGLSLDGAQRQSKGSFEPGAGAVDGAASFAGRSEARQTVGLSMHGTLDHRGLQLTPV